MSILALAKTLLFFAVLVLVAFAAVRTAYRASRAYLLSKRRHEFRCLKCGKCCILKVEPTAGDIKRIESAGRRRRDFMEGRFLKRVKGRCIFLKRQGRHYICSIHEHKPAVCRAWPFTGVFRSRFLFRRTFSCPAMERFFRGHTYLNKRD